MPRWTLSFVVLALIAAVLESGGIAAAAAGLAQILFFSFLVLPVIGSAPRARGAR